MTVIAKLSRSSIQNHLLDRAGAGADVFLVESCVFSTLHVYATGDDDMMRTE